MKAAFYTLGCKVNQYDTEAMLESFERAGYEVVPFSEDADVYLVNTCTVTGTGDQKSLKTIRRVAREHPGAAIIASGCLAQRDAEVLLQMDGVRLALGVQRRGEVVELLQKALREDARINAVAQLSDAPFETLFVTRHEGKTRATMKIQEGCDRNCAYCIIPSVRGPVRSMPLADVRAEAARLREAGYLEIVITGIHLASYGRGTGDSLLAAIRAVHETGARVRLGSLEPLIATDDFARALSEMPNLMRQFHLSLQSGSAGVLRRMRRRYTPDGYLRALENIRRHMPNCAVTTDVIAGFPGETDAEHAETRAFLESAAFARVHVFPYSRRAGTPADQMDNQVDEEIKRKRALELIAIGNKLENSFVKSLIGTVETVLFEGRAGDKLSEGYTQHSVRVRAQAEPGEIRRVLVTRAEGTTAFGEPYRAGGEEMDCIFCKIISGEIPSDTVYEDEYVTAFRDINPLAPVHVLIAPKKHLANILECDDETAARLARAIGEVARRENVDRTGFRAVANCGKDGCQSVDHLHVHLLGGKKLSESLA